ALAVDGQELQVVRAVVAFDVDLDLGALAGGDVELPQAEVLFVDDDLAVGGHRRPEQGAAGVVGDLGELAGGVVDLPEVVDRLQGLGAAAARPGRAAADEGDVAAPPRRDPVSAALRLSPD